MRKAAGMHQVARTRKGGRRKGKKKNHFPKAAVAAVAEAVTVAAEVEAAAAAKTILLYNESSRHEKFTRYQVLINLDSNKGQPITFIPPRAL